MQLCVRGKKQVGFLGFCSPLFWHSWDLRRKPRPEELVVAGCGGRGVPAALSFPVSFVLSLPQPCLEGCWGKPALKWRQGGEERQRRKEVGTGGQEGKGYPACLSGHKEPSACAGVSAGRVVQPVSRQGCLLSKSSWLLGLSCVTREVGGQAGERQGLGAVEAARPADALLHAEEGDVGEGALEPWPAPRVPSQPSPGAHVVDFKCERNHLQLRTASAGWQPAARGAAAASGS